MYKNKIISIARRHSPKGLQTLRKIRSRVLRRHYSRSSVKEFLNLCDKVNHAAATVSDGTNHVAVPAYSAPTTIHSTPVIEINNTCNIDCAMCLTSLATRKKGKMEPEIMDRILQRLKPYDIVGVELHTIGDPLANPNLESVLQKLRAQALTTAITTNGLLLERHVDTIRRYLDVVVAITFSIDGATKETYERIRLGGKWETIQKSMEIARDRLSASLPIHINMVVSGDNCHEIGAFITKFRAFVFDPGNNLHFSVLTSLSPDTSYFEKFNLFKKHTRKNIGCNKIGGQSLFFHINGDASICCRDYDGSLVIGNVSETPIDEILVSRKLKDLQTAHESRDLNSFPLCNNCYVADDGIREMVPTFLRALVLDNPDASAEFYQDAFEELITAINTDQVRAEILTSRVAS